MKHLTHKEQREMISRIIRELKDNPKALEKYIIEIGTGAQLAAKLAEGPNDRNYINAHAAMDALHECGYSAQGDAIEQELQKTIAFLEQH